MKDYILHRHTDGAAMIMVMETDPRGGRPVATDLQPSHKGRLECSRLDVPVAFAWGHAERGSFCTAHSILTDWLGREAPVPMADAFKRIVIETIEDPGGAVRHERVARFLNGYGKGVMT